MPKEQGDTSRDPHERTKGSSDSANTAPSPRLSRTSTPAASPQTTAVGDLPPPPPRHGSSSPPLPTLPRASSSDPWPPPLTHQRAGPCTPTLPSLHHPPTHKLSDSPP